MADLLTIGGNALRTNQSALAVVSNNIANVNTEGYVRQELDVSENLPSKLGTIYIGSGAVATGVKRAYDSLVEGSLRASLSDLSAQRPLIQYTNRLIDVFGSEEASLTPALDDFFGSMKALSQDPSSTIRRDGVISDSRNLTSRFQELARQLNDADLDTQSELNYRIEQFNSLTDQLITVNQRLLRSTSLSRQQPDLLNTRDKLLTDMSELLRISVNESSNGVVDVNIGQGSNSVSVLTGGSKFDIAAEVMVGSPPAEVNLLVDPYGKKQNLAGLTGGEIGGLLQFRQSVLDTSWSDLNYLAQVVSSEVNKTLKGGMDSFGNRGVSLFETPRIFQLDLSMAQSNFSVNVNVVEQRQENGNQLEFVFDKSKDSWLVKDLTSGSTYRTQNSSDIGINGLRVQFTGMPSDGDVVRVSSYESAAESISVAITDSRKLATGDLFGITYGRNNSAGVTAGIDFLEAPSELGVQAISDVIVNNPNSSAAVTIGTSLSDPIMAIPAGTKKVALTMDKSATSSTELQIFTKDGRHIFGSSTLTQDEKNLILSNNDIFGGNVTYSSTYLNGDQSYLAKPWRMGQVGESLITTKADGSLELVREAMVSGSSPPSFVNNTNSTISYIERGALALNGVSMSELTLAPGEQITSAKIVSWLNSNISGGSLTAGARNIITVPSKSLDLTGSNLNINGTTIDLSGQVSSVSELTNRVNAASSSTKVFATLGANGEFVLQNLPGFEANTISISSNTDVLRGVSGSHEASIFIQAARTGGDFSKKEVALTVKSAGSSTDMAKLGFSTSVYLDGTLDESLFVFASGSGSDSGSIFGSYEIGEPEELYLRDRETSIEFTSQSNYRIKDSQTGTILAERDYSFGDAIGYGNFSLMIEGEPQAGDSFVVDGNRSGLGSNENVARLIEIQDRSLVGESQTLHEGYLSMLTSAGNLSNKASVAEEALEVVYDQAVRTKDQKAGVNLDEEAANLIRFQQSYQASARLMATANQLFDALLRI